MKKKTSTLTLEHLQQVTFTQCSIRNLKLPVMIADKYWMERDNHVREVRKMEREGSTLVGKE